MRISFITGDVISSVTLTLSGSARSLTSRSSKVTRFLLVAMRASKSRSMRATLFVLVLIQFCESPLCATKELRLM